MNFSGSRPCLPVLDAVLCRALLYLGKAPLVRTAVVYVHHPLQTSINLLEAIIALGVQPNHIAVLGKLYSECDKVVDQIKQLGVYYQPASTPLGLGRFAYSFTQDINLLWAHVMSTVTQSDIDNILILDHGGRALGFIPGVLVKNYRVVGVEKTTAGLINPDIRGLPFPIIEVASCAAKKAIESHLIANTICAKLIPFIPLNTEGLLCGVVGYGSIGKAISEKLRSMGHKVLVYDNDINQLKELEKTEITNDIGALISASDYIFGCTGRDITENILEHFRLSSRNKTLVSCSSEDKEFLSLLQMFQMKQGDVPNHIFDNVNYRTDMGATITILRGGFPVNFDASGESVPSLDIQLTRSLVFAGILQAQQFFNNPGLLNKMGFYALDTKLQKFIVTEWLKGQAKERFSSEVVERFFDEKWIAQKSGGVQTSFFERFL